MEQGMLIDSCGKSTLITTPHDLNKELRLMKYLEPQIALLEVSDFGVFTIGIGQDLGFVEYMAPNHEPPYLLASRERDNFAEGFVEFDSGGTKTPVPKNKCLPIHLVIKIVIDSFRGKKLPEYIDWSVE